MDANEIVALVGSVGFPIIACIAMAAFYATQFKDFQDMVAKNNMLTEELVTLLRKNQNDA